MKFKYDDGLVVEYTGSVHVKKGDEIDVFISEDFIPDEIRQDLAESTLKSNYNGVRKVATVIADTMGRKACVNE